MPQDLPRYGRAAPTIAVSDMARALEFYVDTLGFTLTFTNGDPAGFAILHRDDAELHLTRQTDHVGGTANVAHLMTADARALYEYLIARGVRIVKGLRDADFGLRTFVLADPDGNRIDVGEDRGGRPGP